MNWLISHKYYVPEDFANLIVNCLQDLFGNSSNTLEIRSYMTSILNEIGNYDGSLKIYRDVSEKKKLILGNDHSDILALLWRIVKVEGWSSLNINLNL